MQDRDTSSEEDRASEVDALGKQRWLTAAAVVGGTIGLLTALVGVAQPRLGDAGMSPTAVAMVNGEAVREESLMRALTMLATDRRATAEPIARREVLARLIEEELLVQRALDLGLVRSDASVRRALVRAGASCAGARDDRRDCARGVECTDRRGALTAILRTEP
jgi:hypothetical protein